MFGSPAKPGETTMPTDSLAGRRILVVEDNLLIAMMIEETLRDLGCVVVGPVGKVDDAVRLASGEVLDGAILDVNILGGLVYPAAERLLARGIPFVLASGYGDWALPEAFRDRPRLTKPYTSQDIEEQVRALCRESA